MKRRIYKGMIYRAADAEYFNGINLNRDHLFTVSGSWTAGNRVISSYQLCDAHGEPLPEFSNLQFSRSRENMFFLESVN